MFVVEFHSGLVLCWLWNAHPSGEITHEPRPAAVLPAGPELSAGHQLVVEAEVGGQAPQEVQAVALPGRTVLVSGRGVIGVRHPVRPRHRLQAHTAQ